MPKQRGCEYDDYDDGYDDEIYGGEEDERHGEDEVTNYVEFIRSKLAKGVRISDEAIIAQLEVYDYNTNDALKAIQAQLAPKKGNQVKPFSTGKADAVTSTKGTPKAPPKTTSTPQSKAAALLKGSSSSSGAVGKAEPLPLGLQTVFAKAEGAIDIAHIPLSSSAEVLELSDTETTLPAADPAFYTAGKPSLTLVVVGHVDAGKSTLVGHLVHKLGQVSARTIDKYDKESRSIGKASFAFAWVMDERQSERDHGVTIDLAERSVYGVWCIVVCDV
ncbi:hypothetical protein EON64_14850 [archaeon]|nr:MAG: hypothetical protein EON64_14850 [archaeon]